MCEHARLLIILLQAIDGLRWRIDQTAIGVSRNYILQCVATDFGDKLVEEIIIVSFQTG